MDSTDYYHGIIYHANTVEFQCTYPTSTCIEGRFFLLFASSFSVKLNFIETNYFPSSLHHPSTD